MTVIIIAAGEKRASPVSGTVLGILHLFHLFNLSFHAFSLTCG